MTGIQRLKVLDRFSFVFVFAFVFIFVFVFVLVFSFLKSLILHHQEFKDRKYKTDPRDFKPYCFDCFEKLLGHYGDAHYG